MSSAPPTPRVIAARLAAVFRRRRLESELDVELRFHLAQEIEHRTRQGASPAEARRTALRDFGGIERTKDDCRDARGTRPLDELAQDARVSARALGKTPGFVLAVVLTIALGIGATTAIFSVVDGVVLRPLPFADPDRLVLVRTMHDGEKEATSVLDFVDWRVQSRSFEGLAVYDGASVTLTGAGDPERLVSNYVGAEYFSLLRARAILGRTFARGEDQPTAPRVVVLSDALWRRRFGADSGVIGKTISLNGNPHTVIGVVAQRSQFVPDVELWTPMVFPPSELSEEQRASRTLWVMGRLAPGVSLARAQDDMSAVARHLAEAHPDKNEGYSAQVVPLHHALVDTLERPLFVLLGAVGLVLLIACANVANLLLVRGAGRSTEMALRSALGAGRARLVRQLVTESLLLYLLGGALGIALAAWGTRALTAMARRDFPRVDLVTVDGRVLAVAAGLTLVSGVIFGLIPALQLVRPDIAISLRAGGRGTHGDASRRRLHGAIIIAEVAMAVMLLAGAGLLARSFKRLLEVDAGFRPEQVVTFSLRLPSSKYPTLASRRAFSAALLERLPTLPGHQSAGIVLGTPLGSLNFNVGFDVDGRPTLPSAQKPTAQVRVATPDYFRTIGIPLRRGRMFAAADRAGAPQVVVVNEALARQIFPGEEALGKKIWLGWSEDDVQRGGEIVGIVGDVRQFSLEHASVPEIFLPFDQAAVTTFSVVARTSAEPALVEGAARRLVREMDPELPIYGARTLDEVVANSLSRPRFLVTLLGVFAAVALLLAAVGLYGVIAYAVRQRTREIGVRIALGAQRPDVLRLVVRQGLRYTTIGVGLGAVAAAATTQTMRSLLFGVEPLDPVALGGACVVLVGVAAIACMIPAYRAARVDPLTALRQD